MAGDQGRAGRGGAAGGIGRPRRRGDRAVAGGQPGAVRAAVAPGGTGTAGQRDRGTDQGRPAPGDGGDQLCRCAAPARGFAAALGIGLVRKIRPGHHDPFAPRSGHRGPLRARLRRRRRQQSARAAHVATAAAAAADLAGQKKPQRHPHRRHERNRCRCARAAHLHVGPVVDDGRAGPGAGRAVDGAADRPGAGGGAGAAPASARQPTASGSLAARHHRALPGRAAGLPVPGQYPLLSCVDRSGGGGGPDGHSVAAGARTAPDLSARFRAAGARLARRRLVRGGAAVRVAWREPHRQCVAVRDADQRHHRQRLLRAGAVRGRDRHHHAAAASTGPSGHFALPAGARTRAAAGAAADPPCQCRRDRGLGGLHHGSLPRSARHIRLRDAGAVVHAGSRRSLDQPGQHPGLRDLGRDCLLGRARCASSCTTRS